VEIKTEKVITDYDFIKHKDHIELQYDNEVYTIKHNIDYIDSCDVIFVNYVNMYGVTPDNSKNDPYIYIKK
jgi:hypothetical protein